MDALGTMFDHHCWATLALIDHCAALDEQQVEATAPGTYGTIRATLTHLVAADGRYLARLTGVPREPRVRETGDHTLADVRAAFTVQAEGWRDVVARVDELDVTLPADEYWPEQHHAQNLLLLQAIHHGNDHRTHVCTVMGAAGIDDPELSGWAYWAVRKGLPH